MFDLLCILLGLFCIEFIFMIVIEDDDGYIRVKGFSVYFVNSEEEVFNLFFEVR